MGGMDKEFATGAMLLLKAKASGRPFTGKQGPIAKQLATRPTIRPDLPWPLESDDALL